MTSTDQYPNPGNPGPPPPHKAPPAHDGLAVTSFILSLLWLGGLGSLLAVIFGHRSRGESKRNGRDTSALATAGVVIGYVGLGGIVLLITLIVGVGVSSVPTSPTGPAAAVHTTAPGSTATASALSATEQQYVTDMRSSAIYNIGSSTSDTDTDIAMIGETACASREGHESQPDTTVAMEADWTGGVTPMMADSMVRLAEHDMCPQYLPPQTVTYIVKGTPGADVTYGPDGSDYNGYVPMRVTRSLGDPEYYAINAQLQGDGSVSCRIQVDGITVSSGTANGGFNIAQCEIGQDPDTSLWENDNDN